MPRFFSRRILHLPLRNAGLRVAAAAALVLVAVLAAGALMRSAAAGRLRAAAAERGLGATWRSLEVGFPPGRIAVAGLAFSRPGADTVFRAESLEVTLDPWSLLILRPRPASLSLGRSSMRLGRSASVDPDTLAPSEPGPAPGGAPERYQRLRRNAGSLVRLLLAPARRMPRLAVRELSIEAAAGEDAAFRGALLSRFELAPTRRAVRLTAQGALRLEHAVPFELNFEYGRDDRLNGSAVFLIPAAGRRAPDSLRLAVSGRLRQDRHRGVIELGDSTQVTIGVQPFTLSGSVARAGPAVRFALAADDLDQDRLRASIPSAVLGPLTDLSVRGWFDYRLTFGLDLAQPDSVTFEADVVPHQMALDPSTRLGLFGLDQPFAASIHLPHQRVVTRELSPANPHFRPLERIDSLLVAAVVTNEDGGFFHHRGFNLEAVRRAIATNLKAGAYRRGAGTITMQLVRNLYLGHERTLSRKAQEVVLAWVIEHLTGLSKRRLLEIYLNIVEWGPGVQGADEATYYYFGHDAGQVTPDEALFLSTVLPSPTKWRYRFDADGGLRPFERAQMHFIGRAMVAKGWLDADRLPPTDSLRVELRGPAHDVLFPPPPVPPAEPEPDLAPPAAPGVVPSLERAADGERP